MPPEPRWVYVAPERYRAAIEHYELRIAELRLTLAAVEQGQTIITGEDPVDPRIIYFTCAEPKGRPYGPA